eukprot:8778681-Pyramimonas_sp.AAC.1
MPDHASSVHIAELRATDMTAPLTARARFLAAKPTASPAAAASSTGPAAASAPLVIFGSKLAGK